MRRVALSWLLVSSAVALTLALPAAADCSASPCVDAEPAWLTPSALRFALISDTGVPSAAQVGASATLSFRLRPAVLNVPAPNRDGRDVNLLRHATDLSLGARLGLGNRLELTVLLPAGLYQRGAGIKGITQQSAPEIATTALHDPRLGFGVALPVPSPHFGAKLRFEAKLPLGNDAALLGEQSFVASPSLALSSSFDGFFAGAELGARLRRPTDFFGARVGSQALLAAGAGYELWGRRLSLAAELYLLPSLVRAARVRYLPAEWLASVRYTPRSVSALSFGVSGGSGLPLSGDAAGSSFALGVPTFRSGLFARWTPVADRARSGER